MNEKILTAVMRNVLDAAEAMGLKAGGFSARGPGYVARQVGAKVLRVRFTGQPFASVVVERLVQEGTTVKLAGPAAAGAPAELSAAEAVCLLLCDELSEVAP